jgi:hypothetical protein
MKTLIKFIFIASVAVLFGAGCASRTIEAASTKLEIRQGKYKGVSFTFPKELDSKKFEFSIDPKTDVITLKADTITTSSQGVIDRAGAAQAQAMGDMSKAVSTLVTTVAPMIAPQTAILKAAEDTPAE